MKPISGEDLNLALNDMKYNQLVKLIEDEINRHNHDFERYLEDLETSTVELK